MFESEDSTYQIRSYSIKVMFQHNKVSEVLYYYFSILKLKLRINFKVST